VIKGETNKETRERESFEEQRMLKDIDKEREKKETEIV